MISAKIVDSVVYPFFILFIVAGVFFLFYYKFLNIRYFLLSLKIVAGVLDWKGSRGKITPGRAFFSGIIGSFFPGQFIGLFLALSIGGPSIIIPVFILHFLQASVEFVLSTASFKFRSQNDKGNLETGLVLGIEKYSRIRWFGTLYGIFFGLLSLFYGIWSLFFVQNLNTHFRQDAFLYLESSSIMIGFIILLILIFNGGIRRIGLVAKLISFLLLVFLFLNSGNVMYSVDLLGRAWQDSGMLFHGENRNRAVYALVMYMLFSETPNAKLNIFSGFVRSNYPAKQGIATILYAFIQSVMAFFLSGMIYRIIEEKNLYLPAGSELPYRFFQYLSIIPEIAITTYWDSRLEKNIIFLIFLSFVFSSFLTWFFAGNHILRQLFHRIGLPNVFPVAFFLTLFIFIFFVNWQNRDVFLQFLILFLSLSGLTGIFSLIFALIYHILAKYELLKYEESYEGGMDISRDLFVLLFSILPSNLLSKIFGYFSTIKFPRPVMIRILRLFAKIYRVNLDEVKKDISEFQSLNDFFIREIKEEYRPVHTGRRVIVSPVDGTVIQMGTVHEGLLIQTKGVYYKLEDLLGDEDFYPYFDNGKYCAIYLSPRDYHRIHAPFDCFVEGYTYAPGSLFPVNQPAVEGLYGLFPKNERLTTFLKTSYGRIAMVKVGATNVGRIRVLYDSIETNAWLRRKKAVRYNHKIFFKKGQEIARFEMGSSVILIFEKNRIKFSDSLIEGLKVKFGEGIATFEK